MRFGYNLFYHKVAKTQRILGDSLCLRVFVVTLFLL